MWNVISFLSCYAFSRSYVPAFSKPKPSYISVIHITHIHMHLMNFVTDVVYMGVLAFVCSAGGSFSPF